MGQSVNDGLQALWVWGVGLMVAIVTVNKWLVYFSVLVHPGFVLFHNCSSIEEMKPPSDCLLKYDAPMLVTLNADIKSPKARLYKLSPRQPAVSGPVPPPPKPKSTSAETEGLLNSILPPREWSENNQRWVQQVSSAPATRWDVVRLQEELDLKLTQSQARETGICSVRSQLYSDCFDELTRQITINCPERGLLLQRVREEIQITNAVYQTLHASGMAMGIRKALQAEQGSSVNEKISELENEKKDLMRKLNELKAKYEETERQEAEQRQVEEKKHAAQIQLLKRTKQQLKAHLEEMITPKK